MPTMDSYHLAFWRSVNIGLAARGRADATAAQAEFCYRRGWAANEAALILAPFQEPSDEAIRAFAAFGAPIVEEMAIPF